MKRVFNVVLAATALLAAIAQASGHQKITLAGTYSDFTEGYGAREIVNAEYSNVHGANTYVLAVASGKREYDNAPGDAFNGQSSSATFYRHWNPLFSTRSSLTLATNSPVFARRIIDQDVTYKGLASTTITVGAKHSEYYGGVDANAWSLGGAYYAPRLTTSYRYTHYDISGIGDSYGMTLSLQLKDAAGQGASQLWLGKGTSIQEYVWSPVSLAGDFKSVALRRIQPLSEKLAVSALVEQAWYSTPVAQYRGLTGQLSLSYSW